MRKFFLGFILGIILTLPVILVIDMFKEPEVIEKVIVKEIEVPKEVEVIRDVEVIKEVIRKTDLEEVVANCKNSCVTIYAYKGKTKNQGSGWIYNGYVVTASTLLRDTMKYLCLQTIPTIQDMPRSIIQTPTLIWRY